MKKNSSFTRQKLELLSLNPEFQKDVFIFREKWKIPKDGFKDNEGMQKYEEWLGEISDEYRNGKYYNKKRHSLFEKRDNAINKKNSSLYRDTEKEIKLLEMQMPLNDFFNDQKIISSKHHLSDNYKHTLDVFLRSDNFHSLYISRLPIRTWYEKDLENKGKKKIFLEIYGETTIKDIQDVWSTIKRWQKATIDYKEGRKRSKSNFLRDKRIYKLSLTGLTYPKITPIIKEEFGTVIMYDEIAKIILRMKKKIMDT